MSLVQRARLQCCGKTPRALGLGNEGLYFSPLFLFAQAKQRSAPRRAARPPRPRLKIKTSISVPSSPDFISFSRPRPPAVPLSVATAKIYIRIFGPRDRVHCLKVVIRRARACEHNTGSLVLNRIDLYLLMIILISGAQIPRFNYSSLQCDVARVTTRQKLTSLFQSPIATGPKSSKAPNVFPYPFPLPIAPHEGGDRGRGALLRRHRPRRPRVMKSVRT